MFGESFFIEGRLSLRNYNVLLHTRNIQLLINSILLASLTVVTSSILGIVTGLLFGKTDIPMKGFFRIFYLIPFVIPSYVYALAWAGILGKGGFLNEFLSYCTGISQKGISDFIYSIWGSSIILGFSLFPIMMLITENAVSRINPRLEEGGIMYTNKWIVLKNITLPLIAPGILSGGLMIFILAISEFGVPSLLQTKVYTTQIFTQFSAFYNEKAAVAYAIPLVGITFMLMILEGRFLKGRSFEVLDKTPFIKGSLFTLGRIRIPCLIMCFLILLLGIILPLAVLIIESETIFAYKKALSLSGNAIKNTLFFGCIGATVLTMFGFFLGYLSERSKIPFSGKLGFFIMLLFAVPATVIGIGLIKLWNKPHGFFDFVYGSLIIIIIGYVARFSPISNRLMVGFYKQISVSQEEAAGMTGASWFKTLSGILLPLLRYGIFATWIISFIFCTRELGTTILVYPPGHETLPIALFTVMANSPTNVVSALAVILIAITLVPLGIFYLLSNLIFRKYTSLSS